MARKYAVEQHDAALKPVVTVTYDNPEQALAAFCGALHGAGHDDGAGARALSTWTAVLMKGGTGYTVTDPDLRGSVTIRIMTR
jgi:hypothetical protein